MEVFFDEGGRRATMFTAAQVKWGPSVEGLNILVIGWNRGLLIIGQDEIVMEDTLATADFAVWFAARTLATHLAGDCRLPGSDGAV